MYAWLNAGYAILFCTALWLNRKEWRMLALSSVVAIGIFVPIPATAIPATWYYQCMLIELLVALAATYLHAAGSTAIVLFAILLGMMHLTGSIVGPQPGIGPYRIIIPILEISQLLVCILMSFPILHKIAKAAGLARPESPS